VGLEKRIHDKVKTYSLGMRQRLGLAQALLHRPSLLILDEPTNGLDPAGIREIRDYLRKLAKEEGLGIIVSSHLLSEMEMMCNRFAIIQHGRLVGIESVQELSNTSIV
jgi:ABC-2 type transport system ATP-binding protein